MKKTKEEIESILMENYPSKEKVYEFIRENPDSQQEKTLIKLFSDLCPTNTCLEDIIIKCATLNALFSTNIYDITAVATRIHQLQIDEHLKNGDPVIVNQIAEVNGRQFYSFATKYCSHHQPKLYSIYDSYVHKVLVAFNKKDQFSSIKSSQLREYEKYRQMIEDFRKYYGLETFTLKELDKYLWQVGKKAFSPYSPK